VHFSSPTSSRSLLTLRRLSAQDARVNILLGFVQGLRKQHRQALRPPRSARTHAHIRVVSLQARLRLLLHSLVFHNLASKLANSEATSAVYVILAANRAENLARQPFTPPRSFKTDLRLYSVECLSFGRKLHISVRRSLVPAGEIFNALFAIQLTSLNTAILKSGSTISRLFELHRPASRSRATNATETIPWTKRESIRYSTFEVDLPQ